MPWAEERFAVAFFGSFALLGLVEREAGADPIGFDVNRLEPSETGSDWFANESLDLRGSGVDALATDWPDVGVVALGDINALDLAPSGTRGPRVEILESTAPPEQLIEVVGRVAKTIRVRGGE
jgi:hypothetical protein